MEEEIANSLWKALTHKAKKIIQDDKNWSRDFCPKNCAFCKKLLGEKVPLHLWKNDGKDMISFHMKCAFGDKVTEPEENEGYPYERRNFPNEYQYHHK